VIISETSDSVVGRPIARDTLRATERGTLVTCTNLQCEWQGLFPTINHAVRAVQAHYDHERGNNYSHNGSVTHTVVDLLDAQTACMVDVSQLGLSVGEQRYQSQCGAVREAEFPRTTESVADLVERGDRIELPDGRYGKVASVSESRSSGLPVWSVRYADPDTDLTRDDWQPKFQNELVARDGSVYCSYGPDPLAAPVFDVVGETDHQADFTEFGGGASA